ncbi:MFS transporter [Arthrobacter caoxuetaonis]|uniref:MFS transporter n=1 Tax=Arthrobacter caoxuetaonis TaxID=2886935 RepID=A0A9X1MFT8_9MICC|nr:MFS transporter [Arthrobacter caoxuetaonis]MCC3297844.1 MFS transporter [Arthrobacter caoxuetaonis]USQ55966.1 MFS transporter [Arthrobacter caoxuetaonis]
MLARIGAEAIGILVAAELLVSVAARPAAGWLADKRPRTVTAASGALLYAVSCLGYTLAGSLSVAFGAAILGGVGGALFWVSIRALAAEFPDRDSGSMAGLLSSEAFGRAALRSAQASDVAGR